MAKKTVKKSEPSKKLKPLQLGVAGGLAYVLVFFIKLIVSIVYTYIALKTFSYEISKEFLV